MSHVLHAAGSRLVVFVTGLRGGTWHWAGCYQTPGPSLAVRLCTCSFFDPQVQIWRILLCLLF